MKILLIVPVKREDQAHPQTRKSLLDIVNKSGHQVELRYAKGTLISEARNRATIHPETKSLTKQNVKGFDFVMYHDSDVVVGVDQFNSLVNRDLDIVAPAVPYRSGFNLDHKFIAGVWGIDGITSDEDLFSKDAKGLVKVDWTSGTLLCKVSALNKIDYPYFAESVVTYHKDGISYSELLGEDIGFALNCKRNKISTYVDFDCIAKHLNQSGDLMRLPKAKVVELNNVLHSVSQMKYSENFYKGSTSPVMMWQKFVYIVNKNIGALEKEIKAIQAASNPSDAYLAYESERVKLAREYADKNDKGEPVMKDNNFIVIEKRKEFSDAFDALRAKNVDILAKEQVRAAEFNKFLEEEVEVETIKIKHECIPVTELSVSQFGSLMELVDEEELAKIMA